MVESRLKCNSDQMQTFVIVPIMVEEHNHVLMSLNDLIF